MRETYPVSLGLLFAHTRQYRSTSPLRPHVRCVGRPLPTILGPLGDARCGVPVRPPSRWLNRPGSVESRRLRMHPQTLRGAAMIALAPVAASCLASRSIRVARSRGSSPYFLTSSAGCHASAIPRSQACWLDHSRSDLTFPEHSRHFSFTVGTHHREGGKKRGIHVRDDECGATVHDAPQRRPVLRRGSNRRPCCDSAAGSPAVSPCGDAAALGR